MSGDGRLRAVRAEGGRVLAGGGAQGRPAARLAGVVLSPVVIRVEEFLEPLQELKVVLETTLY